MPIKYNRKKLEEVILTKSMCMAIIQNILTYYRSRKERNDYHDEKYGK